MKPKPLVYRDGVLAKPRLECVSLGPLSSKLSLPSSSAWQSLAGIIGKAGKGMGTRDPHLYTPQHLPSAFQNVCLFKFV